MRSVTPSGQRADDWICTSIIRFTRPAPFCVEPRRHSGCPEGVEPSPSASQADVPTTYTTGTMCFRVEGAEGAMMLHPRVAILAAWESNQNRAP